MKLTKFLSLFTILTICPLVAPKIVPINFIKINEVMAQNTTTKSWKFGQVTYTAFISPKGNGRYSVFIERKESGNTTVSYEGEQYPTHMIEYNGRIYTAFSGGWVYISSDGYNLLGDSSNTYRAYNGSEKVLQMKACRDGIYTYFTNKTWYHSPDGSNIGFVGSGSRTRRVTSPGC